MIASSARLVRSNHSKDKTSGDVPVSVLVPVTASVCAQMHSSSLLCAFECKHSNVGSTRAHLSVGVHRHAYVPRKTSPTSREKDFHCQCLTECLLGCCFKLAFRISGYARRDKCSAYVSHISSIRVSHLSRVFNARLSFISCL